METCHMAEHCRETWVNCTGFSAYYDTAEAFLTCNQQCQRSEGITSTHRNAKYSDDQPQKKST